MNPDEVKQWIASAVRQEGPDANGNMTYHAADGNYIVVRPNGTLAMRGFSPPAQGSEAQQAPAQETPAAPAQPPGSGGMSQSQLEALLKQIAPNGDPRRLEFNQGTKSKTIRIPATASKPASTKVVQAPYVQWIDRGTGQTLEADVEEGGGGYTVTFNGVKKENQGAQATTPAQAAAEQPQKESVTYETRDGKKVKVTRTTVNGVTSEKVEPVTDKDRTAIGTREVTEGGKRVKYTRYRYPDGSEEEIATDTQQRETPKPQPDGNGGWGVFQDDPQSPGGVKWVPVSGPQATKQPVKINGVYGFFRPKPNDPNGEPEFVEVTVPPAGRTLKNVDEWQPDFSQPDLGIGKWAAAQRQKIGLSADQGGITQDDYDNSVKDVLGRAGTTITNVTSANTVLRQRQQDEEGLRQQRSSEADTDFGRAMSAFSGLVSKGGFDPDSGSLKNVVPGLLWEMRHNREQREATAPQLPALHPMFQIASAQSAATAQPPAAKEQAAATGPEPAPYQPPGQSVQPAFTPQPPVNLPAANAIPAPPIGAAAPSVSAPAMAAPTSAPLPPNRPDQMQAASQIENAINPPAAPSTPPGGILPGANPIPSDMPIDFTPPPAPSTYGGGEDMQKTSLGSGPLSSFASSAMAPAPSAPTMGQPGPLDSLAQQSSLAGGFDPVARAADLERMGVPHEIAVQALVGSGLLDEQTRRRLGIGVAA